MSEIPGLEVVELKYLNHDAGWFMEAWRDDGFLPAQHNVAGFTIPGHTRGFHAEPWDRMIVVTGGRVMGAWVDLRPGESFGRVVTRILEPGLRVTVPAGVGNAFQVLDAPAVISTVMNGQWSPEARERYASVDPFDSELGIEWVVPRSQAHRPADALDYPPLSHQI